VKEIQPTGLDVAPRGHAWKATDEVAVKGDAVCGKPVEVGCLHAFGPVAGKGMAVQRVKEEE
jgi:hypothetical protein